MRVRRAADGDGWELLHPKCAVERADDIQEVQAMFEAGEFEVARDELRWLLGGCNDFIDAHRLLGEIALVDGDLSLARGHFGNAYQLATQAIDRAGASPRQFPYRLAPNRSFLESAKGLAHCLRQLGREELAREIVERALRCDPSDPLGLRGIIACL
ncbi:MAG: hypothetical protein IIA67_01575 [Planctomycetes bacterium]|nr:hypothetical protein [Planctomycetota bacterium]